MVFALKQRAARRVSLIYPKIAVMTITLSILVLFEPIHGQPNYYFKASAPAVKSLPRIGRRSDDNGINDGTFTLPRSMDIPGEFFVWQAGGNNGGNTQSDNFVGSINSGLRTLSSLNAPAPSPSPSSQNNIQMSKALLWRKLFGDGGGSSYDDSVIDSLYNNKS